MIRTILTEDDKNDVAKFACDCADGSEMMFPSCSEGLVVIGQDWVAERSATTPSACTNPSSHMACGTSRFIRCPYIPNTVNSLYEECECMSEELKPCPFCGGTVEIHLVGRGMSEFHIEHTEKMANGHCPIETALGDGLGVWIYDTQAKAISAWNRRVEG